MRCVKSMVVLAALLAFIGAPGKSRVAQVDGGLERKPVFEQGTHPASRPETVGRLEMKPEPVKLVSTAARLAIGINGSVGELLLRPPCCPDPVCCEMPKLPGDFGIFISPQGAAVNVKEAHIEIYSGDKQLLFRTRVRCGGCGSSITLKPTDEATGYLLTLSADAVNAAKKYFVAGNTIRVYVKTINEAGSALAYIVNAGSVRR
jgi:hypothetical protein